MNLKIFIKEIQVYYNMKYTNGTLQHIITFLEKQPFRLDVIFDETILTFSGQYKTLPNIAIFNDIVKIKTQYAKDYMMDIQGERLKFGYKQGKTQITG